MNNMNGEPINTRKFVVWWVGMSFGMWLLGPAIVFALFLVIMLLFLVIGVNSTTEAVDIVLFLSFATTFTTIIGFLVGTLQRYVFRSVLSISFPRWRKLSTIGGFLAMLPAFIGTMINPILMMPMFIGIISLFQWWQLKKYTSNAWLWIFANFIGGMTFMVVFLNIENTVSGGESFGWWSFAVLLQGLITAFTMVWLLQGMDLNELRYEQEINYKKSKNQTNYKEQQEGDDSFLDELLGDN